MKLFGKLLILFGILILVHARLVHAQVVPSVTPTIAPTPQPTSNSQIRKNIYAMTPEELTRLANALNTIRANGSYQQFMDRHMQSMMTLTQPEDSTTQRNVAHRGPSFLPWHRSLLREFEQTLQTVDPSVTIPYWAFESESGGLPRVFSGAYLGGDGDQSQGNRVIDGPFASWGITRMVGRDPQGQSSLPTQSDIDQIMQNTVYDSAPYNEQSIGFRNSMEGWIGANGQWNSHNRVHGYIGGDMLPRDDMSTNPVNDPIFWLVHANVDRLWWNWQQTHGINNYQPENAGPSGHNLNDQMRFLNNFSTPASTLDIRNMGYMYQ